MHAELVTFRLFIIMAEYPDTINLTLSEFCLSQNCRWSPSFSEKLIRSADSYASIH